jgi:hypothetical protein
MTERRARDDRETKKAQNRIKYLHNSKKSSNFGLRHYVFPEVTFAKSCKWQNKINFICTFGFFVVPLQPITDEIYKKK